MTQHYSEADLLETYYTQPGESMPVMMHLASCEDCAARYERLERKVRGLAACEHDKPETFWARQRVSIMRRIEADRPRTSIHARYGRIAAAAILALVLGGLATWNKTNVKPAPLVAQQTVQAATTETTTDTTSVAQDPWQSDQLKDYQSMVAWESWVESDSKTGDKSL